MDENEPWLLIRITNRDVFNVTQYLERHSVSSDQHMKKLMSFREGLHMMMQSVFRQYFADRCWLHEHLGGHARWREPTMRKFTNNRPRTLCEDLVCRWNIQKMQSESNEHVRKTTGFFTNTRRIMIALESHIDEHGKEVWVIFWTNLEVQTTLLSTYPPKLIATILKALREQLKENDQSNAVEEIAGPVPEICLEYDQILKDGRWIWDGVNGGYLPENLVLAARREEIARVRFEGVYEIVPMRECKDAGKKTLGSDLGGQTSLWTTTHKNIRSRLCAREHKTKRQGQNSPLKLRHYVISRAHYQGTVQRLVQERRPAEDRQRYG